MHTTNVNACTLAEICSKLCRRNLIPARGCNCNQCMHYLHYNTHVFSWTHRHTRELSIQFPTISSLQLTGSKLQYVRVSVNSIHKLRIPYPSHTYCIHTAQTTHNTIGYTSWLKSCMRRSSTPDKKLSWSTFLEIFR